MVTLSTCTCSYCTMHAVWSMHACQHGVVDMHAYCGIVYADSAKFLGQCGCESAAGCHQAFCNSHTAAAAKCSHHRMLPHSHGALNSCLRDSVATSTAWHPRACHSDRTYAVGVTMCHDVCYVMGHACSPTALVVRRGCYPTVLRTCQHLEGLGAIQLLPLLLRHVTCAVLQL
mgnify:CR=1 FL=1